MGFICLIRLLYPTAFVYTFDFVVDFYEFVDIKVRCKVFISKKDVE